MLCDKTLSPFMLVLAEKVIQLRGLPFPPSHCMLGPVSRENNCCGERSLSGHLGSCVERCMPWILFCRTCTVSSAHTAHTHAQHTQHTSREREGKGMRRHFSLSASNTCSVCRVQSMTVPPFTLGLPWSAHEGTGLVSHYPHRAP